MSKLLFTSGFPTKHSYHEAAASRSLCILYNEKQIRTIDRHLNSQV